MRYPTITSLAAIIAIALSVSVDTTSATTLTSSSEQTYSGLIHATSATTELQGEAFTVHCKRSTVTAGIETQSASTTAHGPVTILNFSECNFPVTVINGGRLEVHTPGRINNGNGTLTSTNAEITVHGPFGINCLYRTNGTDIGILTGSINQLNKGTATIDIDSAGIPRVGHSAFCGAVGIWTGDYRVTTPDYLDVD